MLIESDAPDEATPPSNEFARMDTDIGMRVRLIRKARGVSQAALGEALGCSFQQIQKYERGVNRMSGATLVRAARFLETDPNTLCGFDGQGASGADDPLRPKGLDGVEVLRLYNALEDVRSRRAVLHLLRGVVADEEAAAEPTA